MARSRFVYGRNRIYENVRVQRETAEGLAIVSLVCGVIGLFVASFPLGPIALVTGGVALHRENRVGGNHRGMAIAGTVLGVVVTVLFVISLFVSLVTSDVGWRGGI